MVTVIVPVYNCEASIAKCVDSIRKQTYSDLEIILVDDGSEDNSGAVCDMLEKEDSRIKVIHKENGGVSSARNTGIDNAKGDYIQFVDSDDYIIETMTEKLVAAMEHNNTQLVICGYVKLTEKQRIENVPVGMKSVSVDRMDRNNPALIRSFLLNSPCNKLYITSYIRNGFREDISLGEDLLFNLSYLSLIDKVSFLEEGLYCYTEQESSLTTSYREDKLEISEFLWKKLRAFAKQYKWCPETIQSINYIFVSNIIYGCYDIWKRNSVDRKTKIFSWIKKDSVQEAVHNTYVETTQQKLALVFIKKQKIYFLMALYQMKKILGK